MDVFARPSYPIARLVSVANRSAMCLEPDAGGALPRAQVSEGAAGVGSPSFAFFLAVCARIEATTTGPCHLGLRHTRGNAEGIFAPPLKRGAL